MANMAAVRIQSAGILPVQGKQLHGTVLRTLSRRRRNVGALPLPLRRIHDDQTTHTRQPNPYMGKGNITQTIQYLLLHRSNQTLRRRRHFYGTTRGIAPHPRNGGYSHHTRQGVDHHWKSLPLPSVVAPVEGGNSF